MSEDKPTTDSPCKAPPITFATFVVSLAHSVMHQCGAAEAEPAKDAEPLQLAKQSIDLLEMLQCKTQGNLDQDEAKLLETLLYEVRMRYLAVSKTTARG